jgi:hypothetical protein
MSTTPKTQKGAINGNKYSIPGIPFPSIRMAGSSITPQILVETSLTMGRKTYPTWQRCTWDQCEDSLPTTEELAIHLKDHAKDALGQWTRGSRCTWQGCTSKALFKTEQKYEDHLKNIHPKPLVCTLPRCTYKKPFRNNADLARHKSTAHSDLRPYHCPFESCEEPVKTFARKDKWVKHIRETPHDGDVICHYSYCFMEHNAGSRQEFTTRMEIAYHFAGQHAAFESPAYRCALGSCASNSLSERWNMLNFRDHLSECHGILPSITMTLAIWVIKLDDSTYVLKTENISPGTKWHDCTLCTSQIVQEENSQTGDQSVL